MPTRVSTLPDGRTDLKSLSLEGLADFLGEHVPGGKETYRARQVYKWMWQRGASSFDEMTNVSKDARRALEQVEG